MTKQILFLCIIGALISSFGCSKSRDEKQAEITINCDSVSLYREQSFQLILSNATETITYKTDKADIVDVEATGLIYAKKVGHATITVTSGNYIQKVAVTVKSRYSFLEPCYHFGISPQQVESEWKHSLSEVNQTLGFYGFDSYYYSEEGLYTPVYVYNFTSGMLDNTIIRSTNQDFSTDEWLDILEERYEFIDKCEVGVAQNRQSIGYIDAYVFKTTDSKEHQCYITLREKYFYGVHSDTLKNRMIIYSQNEDMWMYRYIEW